MEFRDTDGDKYRFVEEGGMVHIEACIYMPTHWDRITSFDLKNASALMESLSYALAKADPYLANMEAE